MTKLKRLTVLLAEIAFAIALVIAIVFAAAYHKKVPFLAIQIVLQSLIVFGCILKQFHICWSNPRLWWGLGVVLAFHLAGVALIFQYGEHLTAAAIGLSGYLEYLVISVLLQRFLFMAGSWPQSH